MTALVRDRNTPQRYGDFYSYPVAANTLIYAGAIVMLNASGYATKGAAATGQIAIGRADERADNSAGSNGAISVTVRTGVFKWMNSTSTDAITIAEIGDSCYIADDQTVAKTDGGAARSVAGRVVAVDSDGVWVKIGI